MKVEAVRTHFLACCIPHYAIIKVNLIGCNIYDVIYYSYYTEIYYRVNIM